MKTKVQVLVEGSNPEEPGGSILTSSPGDYFERGGKHYLFYKELLDGIPQPVSNRVEIGEEQVICKKSGPINTQFDFQAGRETEGLYMNPLGQLPFSLYTEEILLEQSGDSFTITIDYQLSFSLEEYEPRRLKIQAREVREQTT